MAASRPCAEPAPPPAPTPSPAAARRGSTMRGNPGNLRRAAAAKSAAAQARAETGLRDMIRRADPITFPGLAQAAGVSLAFLYHTPAIPPPVAHPRAHQHTPPPP